MPENPFQVLGETIARCYGRDKDIAQLLRRLNPEAPQHTSIVGSKHIGKTVLLNALAESYKTDPSNAFVACVYWNFSRDTPQGDEDFYPMLSEKIADAFAAIDDSYVKHLREFPNYDGLKDIIEMLSAERKKALLVMDNLDNVLLFGGLSRNLWDSLRTLAEKPGLRLVTGSRKRLRYIVGSPEARNSPFWNLFGDAPQILAPYTPEDLPQLLNFFETRSIGFQPGAVTEFLNCTGGIPILAASFCARIWDKADDGASISNDDINGFAVGFADDKQDVIRDLWEDCSAIEKDVLKHLADKRLLSVNDVKHETVLNLKNRGFIFEKSGKLRICRTVEDFINNHQPQTGDLRRAFGTPEDFKQNIKELIEIRFEQTVEIDDVLKSHLHFAVQKLPQPAVFVDQIRALVNRAFGLIWSRELPNGRIPTDWTDGWKLPDSEGNRPERNPPEGFAPTRGGQQCHLLNLMTDNRKTGTTRVSRATYFMLDYLQNVGDFGQHLNTQVVPDGFAYTACLTAIEMCDQLTKELTS